VGRIVCYDKSDVCSVYLAFWKYNSMSFGQLKQIWNIMRLRSGPQSLPFSYGLLAVFLSLHMLINIVLSGQPALHWPNLLSAVVNTLFTAGFVFVLLQWTKKMQRFLQTLLALLGIEILIGLLGGVMLLMYQIPALSALIRLLWLGLIVWNAVIAAHIFRHALDKSMLWGIALSIVYIVLADNVVGRSRYRGEKTLSSKLN